MPCSVGWKISSALFGLGLGVACGASAAALDGESLLEYFRHDTGRLDASSMAARYASIVGQVTGLPLDRPVTVRELPREEARQRFATPELSGGEQTGLTRLLRHFGVLSPAESFAGWHRRVGSRTTRGLYLPESGEVVLIRGIGHRSQGTVLLHELVHAGQDRAASLERLRTRYATTLDGELALLALLEGQAELMPGLLQLARARSEQQGDAPLLQAIKQYLAVLDQVDEGNDTLGALTTFPYTVGPYLVLNLLVEEGDGGYRAMLEQPPASSEQVLHGDKLLTGEAPLQVMSGEQGAKLAAALGGEVSYTTSAGEYFIRALFSTLPQKERVAAAAGWGGDRLLLLGREGRGDLLVWDTRWDTPEDAEEFRQGYLAWVEERLGIGDGTRDAPFDFVAPGLLLYAEGDRVLIVEGEGAEGERIRRAVAGSCPCRVSLQ